VIAERTAWGAREKILVWHSFQFGHVHLDSNIFGGFGPNSVVVSPRVSPPHLTESLHDFRQNPSSLRQIF
jgi:hypothetical protein